MADRPYAPQLVLSDVGSALPLAEGPSQRELDLVSARMRLLTAGMGVVAIACAAVLAVGEVDLALLPIAFVLGWLNLVGL